jgi:hypothetical protein
VRPGLDLHLSHDRVLLDPGDQTGEAIAGRRIRGAFVRAAMRTQVCRQIGTLDDAMTMIVTRDRQATRVGPAANRIGTHTEQVGRLTDPKLRHVDHAMPCICKVN